MFLPRFTGIGIDVSDHHIRIAQVSIFGRVKHLYEIQLPDGLVTDERVVDPKGLKKLLLKEMKNSPYVKGVFGVTVLIPESRVFSSSFILPKSLRKREMREESVVRGQRDIPLPISQAYTAVSQGAKEEGGVRTTLYVVAKNVLNPLKEAFSVDTFQILAMDANTKALLRLFSFFGSTEHMPAKPKELVGVLDVGSSWSTLSFYTLAGSNVYSRTLQHNASTQKTQKNEDPLSPKVVATIISSLKESVLYFENKGTNIKTIMLAGVEASSRSLLEAAKSIEGKIVIKPVGELVSLKSVSAKQLHTYGAAIGAAIRSVRLRKYAYQHNFVTDKKHKV
jgi:hypothetical protein